VPSNIQHRFLQSAFISPGVPDLGVDGDRWARRTLFRVLIWRARRSSPALPADVVRLPPPLGSARRDLPVATRNAELDGGRLYAASRRG
jgi:hypothetical protein